MEAGGIHLLMGLRALLVAATLALLFGLLRARGSPPWLAALLAATVFLAPGIRSVLMRPLLFTHLFLVLYLHVILQVRAGQWPARRLWILPLVMAAWANLHAGHLAGAALVGISLAGFALERVFTPRDAAGIRPWRTALPLAATLLATLANPHGAGVWGYALGFSGGGAYAGQVWEWVSATPAREPTSFFLLGAGALAALVSIRHLFVLPFLLASALMVAPLVASRFLFHGAAGAALALGTGLPLLAPALRRLPAWLSARAAPLVAFMALLAATFHGAWRGDGFGFRVDERFFPAAAVRFMARQGLEGRLLNFREWGGYLLWHRPAHKVFIDGRVAASAGDQLRNYLAVAEARRGFGHVLNRREVELILSPHHLLRPAAGAPFQPIAHDPAWALTYFDDVALIYHRVDSLRAAQLQRLAYRALAPGDDRAPIRGAAPRDLSISEARRALATTPSVRAATYLGVLLMASGDLDEAEATLNRALSLAPDSPPVLNNLGVLARRRGDDARARRLFLRVLELEPTHRNARRNLEEL